jgi:hypothetical protein
MDTSGVGVGVNYSGIRYSDQCLPDEEIYRLATHEMWIQEFYACTDDGWDFETVWAIENGLTYPVLQWELLRNSDIE